ncbi:MAG: glycosyltransferase family 2 protein [Actinobacteria bacterium]|nr:glycosyltransferase family 2 protein [Actinomycetota bacterium]
MTDSVPAQSNRQGPGAVVHLRPGIEVHDMGDRLRVASRRPARAVDLSPSVRPLLAQLAGHGVAIANPAPGAVRVGHVTNGPVPATGPVPVGAPAELQLIEYLVQRGFAFESTAPQPPHHHEAADEEAGRLPSVSCVVVVRNRPRELARCLRSLIRLDYPSELLEVLVVDDASEDATPQVARAFARWAESARGLRRPVPNVRLQRLSVHGGIAEARNQGLLRGRGELIAFTDSDCVASPLWVRRLVSQLRPDVAAVGGGVTGLHTETALQRYEAAYSPLHMGDRPTRVGRDSPPSPTYPRATCLCGARPPSPPGASTPHSRWERTWISAGGSRSTASLFATSRVARWPTITGTA